MKRKYVAPEAEIERFTIADILTESPPTQGGGDIDNPTTIDDDF